MHVDLRDDPGRLAPLMMVCRDVVAIHMKQWQWPCVMASRQAEGGMRHCVHCRSLSYGTFATAGCQGTAERKAYLGGSRGVEASQHALLVLTHG